MAGLCIVLQGERLLDMINILIKIITIIMKGFTLNIVKTKPNSTLKKETLNFYKLKIDNLNEKFKAVVFVSDEISKHLGDVDNYDRDFVFDKLAKYDIIRETRISPYKKWVNLFEIVPKGYDNVGYSNSKNPDWVTVGGTSTINLPPENIINEVLKELEKISYDTRN
jgi:hypothetical protein